MDAAANELWIGGSLAANLSFNVVKWNGSAMLPAGGGLDGEANALLAYHDAGRESTSMYAGGWFTRVLLLVDSHYIALADITPGVRGDLNCDGLVNFDDINCFIAAIIGRTAWDACGHGPNREYRIVADIDQHGNVNFDDIDPFILCLSNFGFRP